MSSIDREDTIKILKDLQKDHLQFCLIPFRQAIERVQALPSADRPQGEWKGYEIPSECSVCGHNWDEYVFGQDIWHDGSVPNYCPHCGAKMKGADDE